LSRYPGELEELFKALGEPGYRARQLFGWLHQKRARDFMEMTSLSSGLRERLREEYSISRPFVKKKLVSELDGTVKYLYALSDGEAVEGALMRHRHGNSLCISTQAGCRMGCAFCASATGGLKRNLTAGEMLGEVYETAHDLLASGEKLGSLVLMGTGEPLDNFDEVMRFMELLSNPAGFGMSLRRLSLSTCGLADGIRRLAEKRYPLTLSVSLHAPRDDTRSELMPVNRRHDIASLLAACKDYFEITGRRISFEYALMAGKNDGPQDALDLAALLKGMNCHVNLIPHNPVAERDFTRPSQETVQRFLRILESRGITATVRRELGSDVLAACGQLRNSGG
jgi:23S rRNA (adenine2503-C2)-methyltransferase